MGERLVKTEVGEKICQQIAEELTKDQSDSSQLKTAHHQKSYTENHEDLTKKYDLSRKLIQSINAAPQENILQNNKFESSWGVESSIQIIHAAQNELIEKCKDQQSIIQYFQDKNLWTPYIRQKVITTSQKMIPQNVLKNKNYLIRNSSYMNDVSQSQEKWLKSSSNYYFSKLQDNVINPNAISTQFTNSSTQKNATSRIYDRVKNIQNLKNELMGQKAQQLAHLEQKIEQLNLRQSQYELQRQKLNYQIQNMIYDTKSFVYQPPSLEDMKKKNDPSQIMKYNEQSAKINYKLAIARIHQRKYSENWKKVSLPKEPITQNNSSKIEAQNNLSQGFNTKYNQQQNTKVSFFMPSLSKSNSQSSKLTYKFIK